MSYAGIESPSIRAMIDTIKVIRKRLRDPDISYLGPADKYDRLSKEFNTFFESETQLFIKVIRGESPYIISSILIYKDLVMRGEMTESDIGKCLADKFIPKHIRDAEEIANQSNSSQTNISQSNNEN